MEKATSFDKLSQEEKDERTYSAVRRKLSIRTQLKKDKNQAETASYKVRYTGSVEVYKQINETGDYEVFAQTLVGSNVNGLDSQRVI